VVADTLDAFAGTASRHLTPELSRATARPQMRTNIPKKIAAVKWHRLERVVRHVPLAAPLPLTRYTVIVPIHLSVGAVFDEELGLVTRSHLRTVSAAIALE